MYRWPTDGLIERVNERIKKQIERVEEMTGDMDAKTNFGLIVIQTELERWKYLVRGFLRARIAKVCLLKPNNHFPLVYCRLTIFPRLTNTSYTTSQPPKPAPSSQLKKSPTPLGIRHYYKTITLPRSCPLSRLRYEIWTIQLEVSA